MNTVAIAGVGLIGGSFALALREAGFRGRIIGVSSPATIEIAFSRGVVDESLSLEAAVRAADLVYLAQPVRVILEVLPLLAPWLRPGALVTDAGSTKRQIVEQAAECLPADQFLGGHPMAGKEVGGVAAAEPQLFRGRPYLLTPRSGAAELTTAMNELQTWVRRMEAHLHMLSPAEHDRLVACTSHVPQLASTALALLVSQRLTGSGQEQFAGPGLRDMTRLAMSDYRLWGDILATNECEIGEVLDDYIALLLGFREQLTSPAMGESFYAARETARKLRSVTA